MTDRMFYEQDILEGLTKKTFYDSSRIVLTDLEQSLLEKTSTSLVFTHRLHARWQGNKVCYSTSVNLKVPALPSASFTLPILSRSSLLLFSLFSPVLSPPPERRERRDWWREGNQELNGSHLIPFTCRFSQETSADEYYIHTCILYTYILHTRARAHTHTHTYTYTYILAGQARGGERMCRGELCILEVIGFYSLDGKSKPSGRR